MNDGKPGRGSDQFALRFPPGLRDRIKDAAAQNGRSMNAEIINSLELVYGPRQPQKSFRLVEAQNTDGSPSDRARSVQDLLNSLEQFGNETKKLAEAILAATNQTPIEEKNNDTAIEKRRP